MSCGCNDAVPACGENPCATSSTNSAECESLPSALDNFITQFFGTVTKTEIDGEVAWILPCDLDVGLEANPRNVDEGLACYFLRLFRDGITGLQGDKGDKGDDGDDGRNGYTVTLTGATVPTAGTWSVKMQANSAIVEGLVVFVEDSGYHLITAIGGDWTVFLTVVELKSSPTAYISAGHIVTPAGPKGAKGNKGDTGAKGNTGDKGAQGDKGDTGAAGTTTTGINEEIFTSGTHYTITDSLAPVNLGTVDPVITLPDIGTYLCTFHANILMDATAAAVAPLDTVTVSVYDDIDADYVPGSTQIVALLPDNRVCVTLTFLHTTDSVNHTLSLYASCLTASKAYIQGTSHCLYVRVE
jgi:hypothetical protein